MNIINQYEKYIISACNLYGMISKDKLNEIYLIHNNEPFDYNSISSNHLEEYFVSELGDYFVSEAYEEDYEYQAKLKRSKPYFIPEKNEFLRHFEDDYFEYNPHFKAFKNVVSKYTSNYAVLENIVSSTCYLSMLGSNVNYIVEEAFDMLGNKLSIEEATEVIDSMMLLYNNTRMWQNNGYSPYVLREINNTHRKVGRNDPCLCGSGLKYKKCCLNK